MRDKMHLTRRAMLASTFLAAPLAAWARPLTKPLYKDPAASVDDRVADLLSRMTLEEKAAQLICVFKDKAVLFTPDGKVSPEGARTVLAHGIGQIARPSDTNGTQQFKTAHFRTPADAIAAINQIQRYLVEETRLGIPALFHEETAHGLVASGATIFPSPPALGSTWDTDLVEAVYTIIGREARLRGATIGLGPVLDIARDPRFGRVEECYGEDPVHVARIGEAAVLGQQGRTRPLGRDKVYATLKHFIHGTPEGGINTAPADMSERTLRAIYLHPFAHVIRNANPAIIMPSYNEVEGIPAHANARLLTDLGRNLLGFQGAYLSDYSAIERLVDPHHVAADNDEAAILALRAGVDADLPNGSAFRNLPRLVREGRLIEAELDAAVTRILRLKVEAGLFEHPYVDARRAVREVNTQADIALARKAAQKSIVLLTNDGILPLDRKRGLKLAVIGPNAAAPVFGGYSGENHRSVGILKGLETAVGGLGTFEYAEGVRLTEDDPQEIRTLIRPLRLPDPASNAARIAEAERVAGRADVIILVVGDNPEITRESIREFAPGDRSTLGLFGDQDALVEAMIATGKPIVAVLINGRALAITRLTEKANALVEGWYLGQEGGNALADVLFGLVNPGGKLAVSFPTSASALPVYYNLHRSAQRYRYIEGKRQPLFPFGHGLSYTTFDISAPRITKSVIARGETVLVEVDVTNTGQRAGDEVVQLYIRDEVSSAPRPALELKAFKRVTLEPGGKRTLVFNLEPDDLAFWDVNMNWVVEPGKFTILAGPNSATLKEVKINIS